MEYLYDYFFSSYLGVLELIASFLTILCVWQLSRQSIWNFLSGGIAVIIFGFIFKEVKLYADMVLQWGYYVPITLFGFWYWYNRGDTEEKNSLKPQIATNTEWVLGIALIVVGSLVTGYFFKNYTTAALPWADSFILFASVYAQYLLSKKYVENWIIWVIVDIVAVPTYALKGLYVTSGLYVILFFLASYGLVRWYMDWDKEYETFGRSDSW